MMDAAAVQALVAAAMQEVLKTVGSTGGGGGGGSGGTRGANIHKHYTRVDKLGGPDEWKEWHYQFSVATRAYSSKNGVLLEIVEAKEIDDITTAAIDHELTAGESDHMHQTMAELFSVLTLLTKGEANQIVRSVEDLNGYAAWKKLYDRFNPKTPASLTAAWREVVRPKRVRDLREVSKAIESWEAKVVLLKREHGEEPTPGLKASLLLEMLPEPIQLTVAQGLPSRKLDYDALKSKVKLMASVQTDLATPKPMDIGETAEGYGVGGWGAEEWDWGVEAVAAQKGKGRGPLYGSCWNCGGAHYQNECPKGSAKGVKGKGKGDGAAKGKGKGQSAGPWYGSCWTCGGAHYQHECPRGGAAATGKGAGAVGGKGGGKNKGKGKGVGEISEEAGEEEQEDVGGVTECWNIFGVDVQEGRKVGIRRRWGPMVGRPVEVKNRFEVLGEIEEEECEDEKNDFSEDCVGELDGGVRDNGEADGEAGAKEEFIEWVADGVDGGVGRGEIVVDSGAAESVCPWEWAPQFPVKEVAPDRKRHFRNASGGHMEHYGEKQVRCGVDGMDAPISMLFQVSDSKSPLASVARITEHGNLVQFGPRVEDNYIFNPATEEKVMLRRKGRKFVLDVNFLAGRSHFSGQA